ncbi:MAG: transporter [Verrucomicrobiales bacterium]|nr:transporter [Verrucomicrobiales bacterium]
MKTLLNIVKPLVCGVLLVSMVGCAGNRYSRSTGEYVDDKTVTAKIKAELIRDPEVKAMDVKVHSFKDHVQLTGFVDTQMQKDRAAEIAKGVQGVEWVKNDLVVKSAIPAGSKVNEAAGAQRLDSNGQNAEWQRATPGSTTTTRTYKSDGNGSVETKVKTTDQPSVEVKTETK